jgi:protein-tyrosine phosphatase
MLVEMPDGLFVDLREIARDLRRAGVRPILAHPERHAELLHEPGAIEELIHTGCLIQVSSGSVTEPASRADAQALKRWFKRGVVHLLGSDGHSPRRRAPKMAQAYKRIAQWAGPSTADRICSTNGIAVLHGLPLHITPPEPARRRWFRVFW